MTTDDMRLVREYATRQSENAFAALVSRHTNLVYSAALRQTCNPQLAEEITQAVFILLARKAASLGEKTILTGWLYHTACYMARSALKQEYRRQHREQEAYMQSEPDTQPDTTWSQLSPLLDEALLRLGQTDRNALVLRYFQGHTLQEVGSALGASEEAAKKRVNRALEKLRNFFARRGVSSTTAILANEISAHSIQAAPVTLAKAVTAAAVAKGVTAPISTLTLIKGALKIMAWTKAKTAIVAVAAVIVATGTTTLVVHHRHQPRPLPKPQPVAPAETDFPRSSWHFAGYGSPESALLSMVWAVGNSDGHNFRNALAPAMQQQFAGKSDRALIGADDKRDFARITGYRILNKQVLWENEVVLTGFAGGLNETQKFRFQRLGDEWKYNGHLK